MHAGDASRAHPPKSVSADLDSWRTALPTLLYSTIWTLGGLPYLHYFTLLYSTKVLVVLILVGSRNAIE